MKIPEMFGLGIPIFSFEFFLPKTPEDTAAFRQMAQELKKLRPHFVTLTYGAGGSARERTIEMAGQIQNEMGIKTVAHLTCITHTRAEIEDILKKIRGLGIDTLVALRGDFPKDGSALPENQRDFKHAADLVSFVRQRHAFSVAVAGYPEKHPEAASAEEDLKHLKAKVDAGGDWIVTQLFFDNRFYFDFVKRARRAGLRCPIVPGIMPVTSYAQLQRFTGMCGASLPPELTQRLEPIQNDKEAVVQLGVEHAVRQCRELLDGGAPGIHFYTLNKSHSTATILSRLRG